MGINYYARTEICDCCSRYTELHVGKNLVMFRGYLQDEDWPDEPPPTPWGEIRSWREWKAALLSPGVEVWDENDTQLEIEQFIAWVEATEPERRARQYRWLVEHGEDLSDEWLDDQCFSFTSTEFT